MLPPRFLAVDTSWHPFRHSSCAESHKFIVVLLHGGPNVAHLCVHVVHIFDHLQKQSSLAGCMQAACGLKLWSCSPPKPELEMAVRPTMDACSI